MGYKSRSLFSMIEDVNTKLFLPHIQRPFVWERDRMGRLFDSLMRNYPIQTFLFWRTKDAIKARKFMPSIEWDPDLSDYYENEKSKKDIEKTFVLDGQQRLQTLYALFAGSTKDATGTKDLEAYADVTAGEKVDGDGLRFPLKFETTSPGPGWYRLRDLTSRDANKPAEDIADAINEGLNDGDKVRERLVRRNISQLSSLLFQDRHFWVEELDGVASAAQYPYAVIRDIFVRVNSGGMRLDAADLMFAAMKQKWEEVEQRVEDIADMLNGQQLAFDKSFPLKCLVVAHGKGAELGPEKFEGTAGDALMDTIASKWDVAEAAFEQLADFIQRDLGLCSDKLVTSYGSFVPLYDFLFHNPKPDEVARRLMTAYYYKAQLFRWFGEATDGVLNVLHGIVGKPLNGRFPIDDIKTYFAKTRETELGPTHLTNIRNRHILLNVVYLDQFGTSPFNVKYKANEPQVDHIYPQSGLRKEMTLPVEEVNHLGNYRFVGAKDNLRKRAEKPDSYFGRLKGATIPVEKHLLLDAESKDPKLLKWDVTTYRAFRDRRLEAIGEIAARVVNAELVKTPAGS